jgi:hypothetical protein
MCAGMSISVVGAHLSTDATFTCRRGRTAVRKISLQVLWRSNRVQHLEVIFGHVQVAEGEVLGSFAQRQESTTRRQGYAQSSRNINVGHSK